MAHATIIAALALPAGVDQPLSETKKNPAAMEPTVVSASLLRQRQDNLLDGHIFIQIYRIQTYERMYMNKGKGNALVGGDMCSLLDG